MARRTPGERASSHGFCFPVALVFTAWETFGCLALRHENSHKSNRFDPYLVNVEVDRSQRSHLHSGSLKRRMKRRQSCLLWTEEVQISNHCHVASLWFSDFNIWPSAPQAMLFFKWDPLGPGIVEMRASQIEIRNEKKTKTFNPADTISIMLSVVNSWGLFQLKSILCVKGRERPERMNWTEGEDMQINLFSSFSFNSSTCATSLAALPLHWDL